MKEIRRNMRYNFPVSNASLLKINEKRNYKEQSCRLIIFKYKHSEIFH